jgi:hypothetical protein
MTVISSVQAPTVTATGVPVGLALTGAVFAVNGLVLGTQLLLDPRDYSQIASSNLHLVHYVIWTACLVAMTQLYPRLGSLRSRSGAALPSTVLALAGVGAALDACSRFVSAFVTPYLAGRAPGLVDSAPDAILLVPLLASGVFAMAATAALGAIAWRRRVFPRPAALLLVLGGVAIPVLGPVSNVLLGLALVWIGFAVRERS